MIIIKTKSEYPLEYAVDGDVGLDLRALEDFDLKPGELKTVDTGVSIAFPKGYCGEVRPKSGLSAKGLYVAFGTIDNGYRGNILVTMKNLSDETMKFRKYSSVVMDITSNNGTVSAIEYPKIAQIVISKYVQAEMCIVDSIPSGTSRGKKGFGSTGAY